MVTFVISLIVCEYGSMGVLIDELLADGDERLRSHKFLSEAIRMPVRGPIELIKSWTTHAYTGSKSENLSSLFAKHQKEWLSQVKKFEASRKLYATSLAHVKSLDNEKVFHSDFPKFIIN